MINIILATFFSTGIFVAFRLFKLFRIDNVQAITINYLAAALFGLIISYGKYSVSGIIHSDWFVFSLVLGVIFILVFYLFALSSQKAGIALTSVASKMSVIIPVTLGIVLYNESASYLKIIGILTALLAFYLSLKKPNEIKISRFMYVLPILILIGTGTVDSMLKYVQQYHLENDNIVFLSMIFLTAFVCGIMVFILKSVKKPEKVKIKSVLGGLVLGLLNFNATYFVILSLHQLESSVVFPIYNSGVIALSTIIGFVAFKEKLSMINWIGLLIAIIAIILISNV